jgi:iron(III) transport system ATP-binding protein
MTAISLQNVSKRFGSTVAVDDVTLDVAAGELFFLLGPSGCGKTTLLRLLAGFVAPDAGDMFFGKEKITQLPPRSRNTGMVFQTYALWPHLSVAKNVAYGLEVRGVGREEVKRRVQRTLKMVRMEGFEERRPTQLSGGQQQRIALARALVIEPHVLLLDEPLSNLDARLRDEMREEIRRLHHETGLTMVYVTHDQKEALALADRLAVMAEGRLVQVGTPREVYDQPASRFVAGFLGDSNFLTGTLRAKEGSRYVVETAAGTVVGTRSGKALTEGSRVVCSVRPQSFKLDVEGGAASADESTQVLAPGEGVARPQNRIAALVEQVAFLGELVHVHAVGNGNIPLLVLCLPHAVGRLRPGEGVALTVPVEQVVVLEDE